MVYFIVNPAAGNGKAIAAVPVIERVMREIGARHTFIHTQKPNDIGRVAPLVDYGEAEAIACVGGDGAVQEYVGLAVGRDVAFAVVPAGSGNDLIYSMPGGGRKFGSFEEKIEHYTRAVAKGGTMRADVVAVGKAGGVDGAGGTGDGKVYFFNIGGTGIDIEVVKDAIPLKRKVGGAAYFISLVKNVATYRFMAMTLTVDGKSESGEYLLVAVCNGAYYGGHLRIAPPAVIDDGKITLCIIRKLPKAKLLAVFPLVKPGRHTNFKEVSFINCSSVELAFEGRRTMNLDGNLCELGGPLSFNILQGAVKLVVP